LILDFHAHLFPHDIRGNRERFFPGEPEFEWLYKPQKSRIAGAQDILAAMDQDGVDISVVFGFPWRKASLVKKHNDYILEKVHAHPQRLLGFACVDIRDGGAAKEAERCLNAGLRGIGELACYGAGMDSEALARLDPIMALARERNVPVLVHVNEPVGHAYPGKAPMTLAQIWGLVARFPKNILVLAHWGGGIFFYALLKKEAAQVFKNVYLDTAASPFVYDDRIYAMACQIFGPEKILFGTDFPLIQAKRYLEQITRAGLDPAHKEAILGGNAKRLLAS